MEQQQRQKINNNNKKKKHFLNYAVMSPKYRLPTWRLHANKITLRLEIYQTPNDTEWLLVFWMVQLATLIERKAVGEKNSAPTFTASLLRVFFRCWCQEVDDGSCAVTEDQVLAECYVEMMLMQMITLLVFRLCCWCELRVFLQM